MSKYQWTPEQIDAMESTKIIELEFGNWKKELEKEPLDTLDSIEGF